MPPKTPKAAPRRRRPPIGVAEAARRLDYQLFTSLPPLLRQDPGGLTPRELVAKLHEIRATLARERTAIALHAGDDPEGARALTAALAVDVMGWLSEMRRKGKLRDIAVVDLCDDWPLVRKYRASLSDWDVWTLDTSLDMLRRSYAIYTDAQANAARAPGAPPSNNARG